MDQRVEQILLTLAQQYAPQLVADWRGDTGHLARALANYGILVIMGDHPYSLRGLGEDIRASIQAWVNSYGQFYSLLAQTLFPSLNQVSAHYTDDKWPVIIFIRGNAQPIIQRMAGYVSPFIFYRQLNSPVSEIELLGLIDMILDELEAYSLPLEVHKHLRVQGVALLKQMLNSQMRQLLLTDFDKPLFTDSQRFIPVPSLPPILPEEDSQITRPDQLYNRTDTARLTQTEAFVAVKPPDMPPAMPPQPETPPAKAEAAPPAESQFGSAIPIFFNRKEPTGKIRRPPIPPIPGDNKS